MHETTDVLQLGRLVASQHSCVCGWGNIESTAVYRLRGLLYPIADDDDCY